MSRLTLPLFACCLLCCVSPAASQTTLPIDAQAAYLHVDTADHAVSAVPIDLAGLGLSPGFTIRIEAAGDWDNGPGSDAFTTMLAVFSGSSSLLSPSLLHRVPDAIDAGSDVDTPYSWPNTEPQDIAEDFAFDDLGVTVVIPTGATHLFVSPRDNYYVDNSDPDGDLGVKITLLSTTAVTPDAASHALSVGPNPASFAITISFALPTTSATRLTVHDVTGRLVLTLVTGTLPAGNHQVRWDGRNSFGMRVASGSYFVLLDDGQRSQRKRLSIVR